MRRRDFLQRAAGCAFAFSAFSSLQLNQLEASSLLTPKEADFYEKLPDGSIHCLLCPNGCVKSDGERGKCRAREAHKGKYYSMVYGSPCVIAIDPVEKCPLFHFSVEGGAFSIATAGCNLGCEYCQNWQFSQKSPKETKNFALSAAQVVEKAKEFKAGAIAFFYTEPTIYYEYVRDIATKAKEANLKTIMVSGGYINELPLKGLFPLIDAFVIGLKGFSQEFYEKIVHGTLSPVLNTLKAIKESTKHLEVVTLMIPTFNDKTEHIQAEVDWFSKNLGPDIPWHFTRFIPQFKLKSLPPTSTGTLEKARKIARDSGMKYVYTGNIPGHEGNHTHCSKCGKIVIERLGFKVLKNSLQKGMCPDCKTLVPGHWF